MKRERYIEIHDEKYYDSDIKMMSAKEIHMISSFCENTKQLNWMKNLSTDESIIVYLENLINKL